MIECIRKLKVNDLVCVKDRYILTSGVFTVIETYQPGVDVDIYLGSCDDYSSGSTRSENVMVNIRHPFPWIKFLRVQEKDVVLPQQVITKIIKGGGNMMMKSSLWVLKNPKTMTPKPQKEIKKHRKLGGLWIAKDSPTQYKTTGYESWWNK